MTNVLSVCFRAEEINMCVRARASTRCLTVVDYICSFLCSFSTWFHAMNWCRRCSSSGRPPFLLQTTRPWGVSPGKRTRICSCIISVCASFSYSHWRAQVYCIKGQALSSLKSRRGRPLSTLFEQRSLGSLSVLLATTLTDEGEKTERHWLGLYQQHLRNQYSTTRELGSNWFSDCTSHPNWR